MRFHQAFVAFGTGDGVSVGRSELKGRKQKSKMMTEGDLRCSFGDDGTFFRDLPPIDLAEGKQGVIQTDRNSRFADLSLPCR